VVADVALFKNVEPTLKAGLGGPFELYFDQSTVGTGGVMSAGVFPPLFPLTLTTAGLPRIACCAGTGDTIAFRP
jgi:hypothetical protein